MYFTDNVSNGALFKESDGVKTLLRLISFMRSRQMALKLMIQLILLEGTISSDLRTHTRTHTHTHAHTHTHTHTDRLTLSIREYTLTMYPLDHAYINVCVAVRLWDIMISQCVKLQASSIALSLV